MRFHAAPPAGEWLNDPNGLVFAGGRYRLFAQHSGAAPDFTAIGWARFSSDDLLSWDFDGVVIPADATGFAYSGSVQSLPGGDLAAYLTRHRADGQPRQRQFRLISSDHGLTWVQDALPVGPSGDNVRDPFVWCAENGDRRMIVAEPCDWHAWQTTAPSRLSLWRQNKSEWEAAGVIDGAPAGVLWEVPALLDFGAAQVLLVSCVDRRDGGADCSVVARIGQFDGARFDEVAAQPLDHGPDFYAAIPNVAAGWPGEPVIVGWAASWATARQRVLPGGGHGGPVTLPRTVRLDGDRLRVAPIAAALPLARAMIPLGAGVTIVGDGVQLTIARTGTGALAVRRDADDPAQVWARTSADAVVSAAEEVTVFIDAGLVELFIAPAGVAVTADVAGARAIVPGVPAFPAATPR